MNFNNCFDTSNVTNMSCLFAWDNNLEDVDLAGIDTSHVTDMSFMFSCNFSLRELDLTRFDTRKVNNMQSMFWGDDKLRSIRTSSSFVIGSSTNTVEMLEDCSVTKIGSYVYATPKPTAKPTVRPTEKPTVRPTAKPTVVPISYSFENVEYDYKNGDSGSGVRKMQQRLIDLGYLSDNADGEYGPKTKAAVEAFQKNNGIHGNSNAYGVATTATQAALMSNKAIPSYAAPRLSSWLASESSFAVQKGHYIEYKNGDAHFHFEVYNYCSQPIVALVIRYCVVDSNNNI